MPPQSKWTATLRARLPEWPWHDLGQRLVELLLRIDIEDRASLHGIAEIRAADVPSVELEVDRIDHRQQRVERNVDLTLGTDSELDGRCLCQRTEEVGPVDTRLGLPRRLHPVSQQR